MNSRFSPATSSGDVRVELAVGPLQVRVGHQRRPAVAGPRDVDHVQVVFLDDPVQMDVDEVLPRRGPPVAQQPGLDVLQLQRLAQAAGCRRGRSARPTGSWRPASRRPSCGGGPARAGSAGRPPCACTVPLRTGSALSAVSMSASPSAGCFSCRWLLTLVSRRPSDHRSGGPRDHQLLVGTDDPDRDPASVGRDDRSAGLVAGRVHADAEEAQAGKGSGGGPRASSHRSRRRKPGCPARRGPRRAPRSRSWTR